VACAGCWEEECPARDELAVLDHRPRRRRARTVSRVTSIRTDAREAVPSILVAPIAQSAERLHGKEKV
jgi:hypothetical protein